jgi:hypothetical protein
VCRRKVHESEPKAARSALTIRDVPTSSLTRLARSEKSALVPLGVSPVKPLEISHAPDVTSLSQRGKIVGLYLCVLAGICVPLTTTSADAATRTPFALMSLAVHDAVKGGWVHEVETATSPG